MPDGLGKMCEEPDAYPRCGGTHLACEGHDGDGSQGRSRRSCGRTLSRKAMGPLRCPGPEGDVRASCAGRDARGAREPAGRARARPGSCARGPARPWAAHLRRPCFGSIRTAQPPATTWAGDSGSPDGPSVGVPSPLVGERNTPLRLPSESFATPPSRSRALWRERHLAPATRPAPATDADLPAIPPDLLRTYVWHPSPPELPHNRMQRHMP